jgi:hypothetical protein
MEKHYICNMETLTNINGYEGLYKISNKGYVLSLGNGISTDPRTKEKRVLKTQIKSNGYEQVKLCKEAKSNYFTIHRLVALHFIEKPKNKKEVNHIDGNKLNNNVKNLQWVTSSENQKHAFKTGLQKVRRGKDHQQSLKVNQLTLGGQLVNTFESIKSIKRILGFNTFGIIKCCKKEKRYKTAYGYRWEYYD